MIVGNFLIKKNCHRHVCLFSYIASPISTLFLFSDYIYEPCWYRLYWLIDVNARDYTALLRQGISHLNSKKNVWTVSSMWRIVYEFAIVEHVQMCPAVLIQGRPGGHRSLELVESHLQNTFYFTPGGRIVYPKLVKIYLNTMIWLVSFVYIFKNE